MFCIKLSEMSKDDIMHAMMILSYYHVVIELFSDGDNPESSYMVVNGEEDLRLAEMAFQMNHRQVGYKCPHCSDDKENNEETCGHLTFTSFIG